MTADQSEPRPSRRNSFSVTIAPRWYQRLGVFIALGIFAPPLLRLPFGRGGWWAVADIVLLVVGAGLLVVSLATQRVVLSDEGVRLCRWRARTPFVSWQHVAGFEVAGFRRTRLWSHAILVLDDGTHVALFDWPGDAERVVEHLEHERRRRA